MDQKLSALEREIIEAIGAERSNVALEIAAHLPFLTVQERKYTGVGLYVHLSDKSPADRISEPLRNLSVVPNQLLIELDTVPSGLGVALFIAEGRLKFLELFTYGNEHWDGHFNNFKFAEI